MAILINFGKRNDLHEKMIKLLEEIFNPLSV